MKSVKKEPCILTPKNVYRFLTGSLPEISVSCLISPQTCKGLTLVKFWREMLQNVLSEEQLNMLFNYENRSRRLSDLMNRTGATPVQGKLLQELNSALSNGLVLQLCERMAEFLTQHRYTPERFETALICFENALFHEDSVISAPLKKRVKGIHQTSQNEDSAPSPLFLHALALAWLAVFSLYGDQMNDPALLEFCSNVQNDASVYWPIFSHYTFGRRIPQLLTGRDCALCYQPLASEYYISADDHLIMRVCQALQDGRKVAVTGMGGIGKTELLRQVIKKLYEKEIYGRIAYVQYASSFADSLRAAFGGLENIADADVVRIVRARLEMPFNGRTLLLIDNVDTIPDNAPELLSLATWGCDIAYTSRFPAFQGFDEIPVPQLASAECERLFAQHYTWQFDNQDEAFARLMAFAGGNPLMIKLLANLARMKHWTLKQTVKKVQVEGICSTDDTVMAAISRLISVGALRDEERKVLAVFSSFPYQVWDIEQIASVFADFCEAEELQDMLQQAAEYGYLDVCWEGYAMHPALAVGWSRYMPLLEEMPNLICRIQKMPHLFFKQGMLNDTEVALNLSVLRKIAIEKIKPLLGAGVFLSAALMETGNWSQLICQIHYWLNGINNEEESYDRLCISLFNILYAKCMGQNANEQMKIVNENSEGFSDNEGYLCYLYIICLSLEWGMDEALSTLKITDEVVQKDNVVYPAYQLSKATLLAQMGKYSQEEYRKCIEQAKRYLDENQIEGSALELSAANMLATVYGQIQEGLQLALHIAEHIKEKPGMLGACDQSMLYCLLGECYRILGEREKAQSYFQLAMSLTEQCSHWYVQAAANYSAMLVDMQRFQEAYEMGQELLLQARVLYGETPHYATLLQHQGVFVRKMGKYEESMTILRKARDIFCRDVGENSIFTKNCELVLVPVLSALGHQEEALALAREMQAFYMQQAGSEHPGTKFACSLLEKLEAGEVLS